MRWEQAFAIAFRQARITGVKRQVRAYRSVGNWYYVSAAVNIPIQR